MANPPFEAGLLLKGRVTWSVTGCGDDGRMDGQLVFPEITAEPAGPARGAVIPFTPRPAGSRRREPSRLDGAGLATRLRHDVERMVAHRRRMLAHCQTTGAYSRDRAR